MSENDITLEKVDIQPNPFNEETAEVVENDGITFAEQTQVASESINDMQNDIANISNEVKNVVASSNSEEYTKIEIKDEIFNRFLNEVQNEIMEYEKKLFVEDDGNISCIPTRCKLFNALTGGKGIPQGRITQFVGRPGSFKSTMAMCILSDLQRHYHKNNIYHIEKYLDSEGTSQKPRLMEMGVKYPEVNPLNEITVENVFKYIEYIKMYKEEKMKSVVDLAKKEKNKEIKNKLKETAANFEDLYFSVIWDTVANTMTDKQKKLKNDPDMMNKTIGLRSRLLSALFPVYIDDMKKLNMTFIIVNQYRSDMNVGGMFAPAKNLKFIDDGKTVPGGNALEYNTAVMYDFIHSTEKKSEKDGYDGAVVTCRTIKNKFFTPNKKVKLVFKFGTGISNLRTSFEFMKEAQNAFPLDGKKVVGIKSVGAYMSLHGYEKKFYAKDLEKMYVEDLDFRKQFNYLEDLAINYWIECNKAVTYDTGEIIDDTVLYSL